MVEEEDSPRIKSFLFECVLGMVIVFAFMYYTTHSEDKKFVFCGVRGKSR